MNRRHDIDALRALAFALVILYHVAMYYVAGWDWHLKSPHQAEWLQFPMRALNLWRMDLVFLVSGLAFGFLHRGTSAPRLLAQRSWRLLLPLAFGMAVVVPYQAYAQAVAGGFVVPGFLDFLQRYYTGGPWPKEAFDGADPGITWNHLWYLAYLWVYTALLILLLPLADSAAGQRWRAAFLGLRGWRLAVVPALPLMLYSMTLLPRFQPSHDLLHDFWLHAVYFTLFVYGAWIGVEPGWWDEVVRLRNRLAAAAVALLAAYFAIRTQLSPQDPLALRLVPRLVGDLYLWCAITAILGWACHALNRPWPWLAWANESVYPWYVLHQTVIIILVRWIAPLDLPVAPEATLLVTGTVAGCWGLTAVIRRSAWLRPLFGLKPRARPRCPAPGPTADPAARSA